MGTEVKRDNGQYQGSPHFVHPDNRFQLQKPIRNIRKEVSRAVIDTAHYYRRPIENSWIFDALGSKVPWNFPPTFRQASKIRLSTISLFFFYSFFFFPPRYFYDVSIIHATKLFQPGLNTFWSRCRSIFRIIRTISTPNCSSLDIFLYSIPKIPAKFKFLIDF